MRYRQRLGIAFGLPLGLHHRLGPTRRTATGGATLYPRGGGLAEDIKIILALAGGITVSLAALLGLKNEGVAFVAIHPAKALRAIAVVLKHAAFEHVIVVGIIGAAASGGINAQNVAQTVDKALRIGKFRPAGIAPSGNELIDLGKVGHWSNGKAQH